MGVSGTVVVIGATPVVNGTSGRVLYNNSGAAGELTTTGSGTVLVLQTAPTLTGPVILNEAVGSSGLTLTGATQTSSFPVLSATQTWNNAGVTFTGIKLTVTNTNSAAASRMIDLTLGSTPLLIAERTGYFGWQFPGNNTGRRSWMLEGNAATDVIRFRRWTDNFGAASSSIWSVDNSVTTDTFNINTGAFVLGSSTGVSWNIGGPDLVIIRDAANTLAQRNGTTAQKLRIYNTFTTVDTAGEWFAVDWATTANVCNLQAVKGSSSGTARVLTISYGGTQASPVAAISVPITSGQITLGGGVITGGTTTQGANFEEFTEMTAPAAGAANTCRIYAQDNGAGKTQLMALFNSGAAQQIAIQP